MIIKIVRGDNFKGLIDYITRSGQYADGEDEARILRLEGIKNIKTATAQLLKSASKAPRRTRRAVHILCRAERNLTDAELEETFRRSLAALGLAGRQYVSVVHDDGHGHLGACELDREGKPPSRRLYSNSLKRDVTPQEAVALERGDVVSRSWDSHACWRLSKVARELEVEFGLKQLRTGVTTEMATDAGERIAVPDWQLKREGEIGLMPLAHELGTEIKAALNLQSWEERAEALEIYGLALRAYEGPNARREGIQIYALADPTHFCNGSSLGKNYGLGALNKRSSVSLSDWLAERLTGGVVMTPPRASRRPSKIDPEREQLRLDYDRYKEEHAQRRAAWSELRREKRRRHRERRDVIKTLRSELLGRGLSKRAVSLICTATRKAMKNEAEAHYLTKTAELSAFPPRRMTWTQWLREEAGSNRAAQRVYEDTHRRITRADQKAAILEAARAKEERRLEAEAAAAEAREKERRAAAAADKAARIRAAAAAPVGSQAPRPSSSAPPAQLSRSAGGLAAGMPGTQGEKPGSSSTSVNSIPSNRSEAATPVRAQPATSSVDVARAAAEAAAAKIREEIGRLLDTAESQRWRIDKVGEGRFGVRADALDAGAEALLANPAFAPFVNARLAAAFERQQREVAELEKLISESTTVRIENGRIEPSSLPLAARSSLEPRAAWPALVDVARKRIEKLDRAVLADLASRAFIQGNSIVLRNGLYAVKDVELNAAEQAILADPAKAVLSQTVLRENQEAQSNTIRDLEEHIAQQPFAPVNERGNFDPSRLNAGLLSDVCAILVKLPQLHAAASKKLAQERLRAEALLEWVQHDCPAAEIRDGRIVSVSGLNEEQVALLNSPPHRAQAIDEIEASNRRLEIARENAAAVRSSGSSTAQRPTEPPTQAPHPSDEEWETAMQDIDRWGYQITYDDVLKTFGVLALSEDQAAILFHPNREKATQARLAAILKEIAAPVAKPEKAPDDLGADLEWKQAQDLMAAQAATKAAGR